METPQSSEARLHLDGLYRAAATVADVRPAMAPPWMWATAALVFPAIVGFRRYNVSQSALVGVVAVAAMAAGLYGLWLAIAHERNAAVRPLAPYRGGRLRWDTALITVGVMLGLNLSTLLDVETHALRTALVAFGLSAASLGAASAFVRWKFGQR